MRVFTVVSLKEICSVEEHSIKTTVEYSPDLR